jgi:hypothetical protein
VCDYVAGKITGEVDVLGLAQVAALTEVCVAAVFADLFVGTSGVGCDALRTSLMCVQWDSKTFKPMHSSRCMRHPGPSTDHLVLARRLTREGLTRHAGRQTLDAGNLLCR